MANIELDAVDGSVGPGIRLDMLLGDDAEITATLVAGDNWVAENEDVAAEHLRKAILEFKPDVVVAGPAFNAGSLRTCLRAGLQSCERRRRAGSNVHVRGESGRAHLPKRSADRRGRRGREGHGAGAGEARGTGRETRKWCNPRARRERRLLPARRQERRLAIRVGCNPRRRHVDGSPDRFAVDH